jgi:very-short-patch-repair endonuclease
VTTLLPGVLLVASHPSTFEAEAMAVQLHTAPDGVLSSTTAARLLGLRGMPTRPIRALVSRRTRTDLPSWVHKASSSWLVEATDVMTIRGFRLIRPVRMLLTLAELFNDFRFERAAEDAWHLDLVSPEEASVFLANYRRQGRAGIAGFERWLNRTAHRKRPSQSGFELDILGAIRRAGLPEPQRQHPVTLLTGEVVHLDFAWPAVMLGVEPGHSWWHGGDLRMRADAARDRACTAVGWEVVRYDEVARADLAGVGRELRTIYERRRSMLHPV